MKEATQQEIDEALSNIETKDSVSDYESIELDDPDVEDGTFNLDNPRDDEMMTDGGSYNVVDSGDTYAVVEVQEEQYLLEEVATEREDEYKFEIVDDQTVCSVGTNFKNAEQVELNSFDTRDIGSYQEVIDAVMDKSSLTTDTELEKLIQF